MKTSITTGYLMAALLMTARAADYTPDFDLDGVRDIWEIHYGMDEVLPGADSDGDGTDDATEAAASTDPLDAGSGFSVLSITATESKAALRFFAVQHKHYQLQSGFGLAAGEFSALGAGIKPEKTGEMSVTVPVDAPDGSRFFRVEVSDVDADKDGLTAWEESVIGTSDSTPDSDPRIRGVDTDTARAWLVARGMTEAGTSGHLREVDVAWLRNAAPNGSTPAVFATIGGSGREHELTTWTHTENGGNLQAADTLEALDGHHVRLLNLEPQGQATTQEKRFVSGAIRSDGNLWLTSRAATPDGTLLEYGSNGFGANVGATVLDFRLAQRAVQPGPGIGVSHHLVVALVFFMEEGATRPGLRLVSWRIDPDGSLTGRDDEILFTTEFPETPELAVAHIDGRGFVASYKRLAAGISGPVVQRYFNVADNGNLMLESTGLPIMGDGIPNREAAGALSGFSSRGHVMAALTEGGAVDFSVWERMDSGEFLRPYFVSDQSQDLFPSLHGIIAFLPELTDSSTTPANAGDRLGGAVAVGDFNNDGFDDLAMGAADRNVDGMEDAGAVYISYGSDEGLDSRFFDAEFSQGTPGINGLLEEGDNFGSALASGDFNRDGFADLAISSTDEDVSSIQAGGAVSVIFGSASGLQTAGNIIFTQEDMGFTSEPLDRLGTTLAAGDLDDDGDDDLIVGAPSVAVGVNADAGVMYRIDGSSSGLLVAGAGRWHQNRTGIRSVAAAGEGFATALVSGHFDGDGRADIAVGVAGQQFGEATNAGAVHVFYGGATDDWERNELISRNGITNDNDLPGEPDAGERFGSSLAAGDFDGDGIDDLAIGIPFADPEDRENAGEVAVIYGQVVRLRSAGAQTVAGMSTGARFGDTLAAGSFSTAGLDDLVVGAPRADIFSQSQAGEVFRFAGSQGIGLITGAFSRWTAEDLAGVTRTALDRLGASLSAGDFDGDGISELAAGMPGYDIEDEKQNAGAVAVGSQLEEFNISGSLHLIQQREEVRGIVSELARETSSGAGMIFAQGTNLPDVHMASVTKVTTLLLAVESLNRGEIAMTNMVPVSERAGTTGGSKMALRTAGGTVINGDDGKEVPLLMPGDRFTLRHLLHGMMNESGNRASVAIGEHVSRAVSGGDPETFISLMHDLAADLEIDALYAHPAGGCISNLQDQIDVLRAGWSDPLFRQLMGTERYGDLPGEPLCGTDGTAAEKCGGPFGKITTVGSYPWREGWKGGNGRLWWEEGQPEGVERPTATICTGSVLAVARRLDTEMLICLQQTGSKAGDSAKLFDYGFLKTLTPDARGETSFPEPGGIIGPEGPLRVSGYAADHLSANRIVTAVIDDNDELKVNLWNLSMADGSFTPVASGVAEPALCYGTEAPEPRSLDLIHLPANGQSLGDFCTVKRDGQHLDMKLWRVGQR